MVHSRNSVQGIKSCYLLEIFHKMENFQSILVFSTFLMLMSLVVCSKESSSRPNVTSKYQIECTMCSSCENPCQQDPSPPPPSPPPPSSSPPPAANSNYCPPPPSPPSSGGGGSNYYSPPPPQSGGNNYYSPPPPQSGGNNYYAPPPPSGVIGGMYYPPPTYKNYRTPPPPNPIVPYFPFYYHTPPPPSGSEKLLACWVSSFVAMVGLFLCVF